MHQDSQVPYSPIQITTPVKKHFIWVDYAKFLCIFLVVYFHLVSLLDPSDRPDVFENALGLLRLPCFFFTAGLLFRFDKYPSFIQYVVHRSRQLLIPYFCFFLILYVFWLLIGRTSGVTIDTDIPVYQPLLECISGAPKVVALPLWFVPCLFLVQCIVYLIFKKMKRIPATVLLLLFPFVRYFLNFADDRYPRWLCFGICFYGIASLYQENIFRFIEKGKNILPAIVSLILGISISWLLTTCSEELWLLPLQLIGSFAILLTAIICMKWVSDIFGRSVFIEKIAGNAIVVLAFHMHGISAVYMLIMWLFHVEYDFFEGKHLLFFVIAILAIISMIIPIWFFNRYTPFVFGKKRVKATS